MKKLRESRIPIHCYAALCNSLSIISDPSRQSCCASLTPSYLETNILNKDTYLPSTHTQSKIKFPTSFVVLVVTT
ncbi:hypothetical protein P8452_02626 [Trifolium repens]|nr:hypothetical protein P8452_02626 [Trifolium repens]